ncbi:MAG: methionyl-tRNA formyltransferase [Calditrichaceae bacterium]|nr:methionyl-tRNA formyltransferase [Calditrichaceae bacterium]MBN2708858.1 methionyl-tRNA formyltransferase [Calditrichaceae bacterium]RQV97615.1 MAG: methionyl-tRNA formyltransferase [Calditrichota bacterium]
MKIVFMGTPEFAVASLKKILQSGQQIAAVVTIPDKPKGRGQTLQPSAVKIEALKHNIPVLQPANLQDNDFIARLKLLDAQLFVVVAFRILPKDVFTIPPMGTVNVHASLLPKYRGAAPINWAIINGESETGVTTMLIDEKVDTGGILLQRSVSITPEMNAGQLHDLLAVEGAELLLETLHKLQNNAVFPESQSDASATKAPKITKEICHLNFNKNALQIHNFIRGLSPYPASFCIIDNKILKIFKANYIQDLNLPSQPGTISHINEDYFQVACASGAINVFEVQLEGKRRMSVSDFLNGYPLKTGIMLS